jgi:hypothetical protein
MPDDRISQLTTAIRRLLRPLVRILLRNGVPFGVFAETARQAYVDVAAREFAVPGRKPTVSRIAVITGLNRKEVSRLWKQPDPTPPAVERYNRAARVIGAWLREPDFWDASGEPRVLAFDDEPNSFTELVRRSSGDIPPRAILDELLRVEAVTRREDGGVELVTHGYVPRTGEEEKLAILGTDVAELVATIDHNLTHDPDDAWFQRKVEYDNLTTASLPELRKRAGRRGQSLLEALNAYMAEHDGDTTPDIDEEDAGCRAVIGIYYYEEPPEDE